MDFHNNSRPNHNLAAYLPLAIAVLSAAIMITKNMNFLKNVAFIPHSRYLPEVWRFLSYALFEPGRPFTILFTGLFLWWVGTPVEQQYGSLTYLLFFAVTSAAAAIATYFVNTVLLPGTIGAILGPEAMLWGATWVFSRINPDQVFHFMFFLPVRAKYFPLIMIGFRLLMGGIYAGTAALPVFAALIGAEILGAAAGVLFLHLTGVRRKSEDRRQAETTRRQEDAAIKREIRNVEQDARPLLRVEDRLREGNAGRKETALLEKALLREFDFKICPLSDFNREDEYCKACAAYSHCLAKDIRKQTKKTGKKGQSS